MSEHAPNSPEHIKSPENNHETSRENELLKQKLEASHEAQESSPSIEAARAAVHEQTPISREANVLDTEDDAPTTGDDRRWWSFELQSQALDRTLASVRNRLNGPEKRLSKVIHQPAVEKASDVAGKTVARPSGILFGGIFSFIGSLTAYLLAKHLGGELHYSIFAVCFVGGFVLGLFVELVWRVIHLHRKH